VHTQLARVGVMLKLLQWEYLDASSRAGQTTLSSDRFCRLDGEQAAVTGASSRVGQKAGRSIESDWSGPTMQLLDPTTGEISKVYLFVFPALQPVCARGSVNRPGFHAAVLLAASIFIGPFVSA